MNKYFLAGAALKHPVTRTIGYGLVSAVVIFLIVWLLSQSLAMSVFLSLGGFMFLPLVVYFTGRTTEERSHPEVLVKEDVKEQLPKEDQPKEGRNLKREYFSVSRKQKEALMQQKSFVLWFTGFSGAGKSTIARAMEEKLYGMGFKTMILDGDNIRMGLNRDLDFSAEGRKENIRRVAEVARLLNEAGIIVITCFISPFEADRESARSIIGAEYFYEVFINSSLETCMERDTKGLYRKALKGEIKDFTGINSPYEIPQNPDYVLQTDASVDQSISDLSSWLRSKQLVG